MGIMGSPMAVNLLKAGHEVTVWNRTASKCEAARAAGARVVEELKEIAGAGDVVLLCVSDTPDVEAVLFGDEGLAEHLRPGQTVVDHSTISPDATDEFAEILRALGVDMLDAPVSGGQTGAEAGTLTIMCGGAPEVFARVKPLLEGMGKSVVHCGGHGDGQRTKVVNQVICALNILAMSEGMVYAQRAGLDVQTTWDVVSSGAAASWMLTNLGAKVVVGDWAPGFAIGLQAKDLRIAAEAMAEVGEVMEGTALTAKLFNLASIEGLGAEGTQALAKLLGWGD
jgi:3-hydroxyisobutyrate dehydrogenase